MPRHPGFSGLFDPMPASQLATLDASFVPAEQLAQHPCGTGTHQEDPWAFLVVKVVSDGGTAYSKVLSLSLEG